MSILTVGAGQQFSTLSKAVAAASDGDTITVRAGTYYNDFTTVSKDVTIEGVGGVAKFVATVAPSNGKAIMVTRADVTVRNIEFSGAKVADANGAGIRYEGGDLTVENSYFHHNQMGLLSNGDSDGTITVRNSEFAFNGGGTGYTHGLYVNRIESLLVEDSYFHDANNGHHIKSRAANTTLTNNRVLDGPNGISSYNIDLPNGGNVVIEDNVIQQNAKSPNVAIISYGAEGNLIANSSLALEGNVVVDDHSSTNVRLVANRTGINATLADTSVWGLTSSQMASGPVTVTGTDFLASRPTLDTSSDWNDASAPSAPAPTPTPTPTPTPAPVLDANTGSVGDDVLLGTAGNDTLDGLAGHDRLDGAAGGDRMVGGTGSDVFHVDDARDVVVEYAGEGFDTVKSSISYSLANYVEHLTLVGTDDIDATGTSYHNEIAGNAGSNLLRGLDGNDRLYGNAGDDRLEGGAGNDFLQGGAGTDTYIGGAGDDTFDWNSESHVGVGTARDVILDFLQGSDLIDLAGIDADADTSGNQAFDFIGTSAFDGTDGQLRFAEYDPSSGDYTLVQGDVNGDRIADFEIKLGGELPDLRASDFVL